MAEQFEFCHRPRRGWLCTRVPNHAGPCAPWPSPYWHPILWWKYGRRAI